MPVFDGDYGGEVGDSAPVNLSSNTGKNDSGSAWGSGLLTFATGFGTAVGTVANVFKGQPKPQTTTTATAAASPASGGISKTWLIVGAVVAGVIVLVLFLRK